MLFDPTPSAGWQARLDLKFARRENATILSHRSHNGPLRVQKALYPEGRGICHAIVLHPPAGICGGDELTIAAGVGEAAHALLTTPGAGKWYRSAGPWARQTLDFEIAAGAALEWLPQESIIFDGAQGAMETCIRMARGATFIGWEVLCLGRRASGERFENGEVKLKTRILQGQRLIWAEQGQIAGGSQLLASPIGLAGFSVCATLLAAGTPVGPELLAAARAIEATEAEALHGLTALPQLLVARYLGHSSEAARSWLVDLWQLLRPAMLKRDAAAPRIWST